MIAHGGLLLFFYTSYTFLAYRVPLMALRSDEGLVMNERPLNLLTLPYDIRCLVYSHLFPESTQIYLFAHKDGLHPGLTAGGMLPVQVLRVCQQMNLEAAEYLYNHYLYNVLGHKKHCIAHYKTIYNALQRFARHGAGIDVLDNGLLSVTACISLFAKGGKIETMARGRERGARRDLREVEAEARSMADPPDLPSGGPRRRTLADFWQWLLVELLSWHRKHGFIMITMLMAAILAGWVATR